MDTMPIDMISIRQATFKDVPKIQACNLECLPENYQSRFFIFHYFTSQPSHWVAIDELTDEVIGYVMGKIEVVGGATKGHITSIAVQQEYRRLGLARKLLSYTLKSMKDNCCEYCSLHVRESNASAQGLYGSLGFVEHLREVRYYADGEDGLEWRCNLLDKDI